MTRLFFAVFVIITTSWAAHGRGEHDSEIGSALTRAQVERVLILHNEARRAVGVGPIRWSPELAKHAQAWADELAKTGKFEHRPDDGEWKRKYGENIAIGFGGTFGPIEGVQQWLQERKDFIADEPIPAEFGDFKPGHYSQIVWRNTKQIGVGVAVLQTGERKGWTVVIANYDPPGNVRGEKPF